MSQIRFGTGSLFDGCPESPSHTLVVVSNRTRINLRGHSLTVSEGIAESMPFILSRDREGAVPGSTYGAVFATHYTLEPAPS
jgi:hypothetical protein